MLGVCGKDEEFHFGSTDFERPIGNSNGSIEEAVGCLELSGDQSGDRAFACILGTFG